MNRRIAVFTVMFIFGWALAFASQAAPRGNRFMFGMKNPEQLATVMDRSLAKDSTGTILIDPVGCHTFHNGSCASVKDFLKEILINDPGASVDGKPLRAVSQVPAFVRTLVIREAPVGKYRMACERLDSNSPTGWSPLNNCVERAFAPGEMAYVDPLTGRIVLAQDCTNPVGMPAKPAGCADIMVPVKQGDEVRIADYGPTDLATNQCTGLKRTGEIDFESPFVERCPDDLCSFAEDDAALGKQHWQVGSWRAQQDGYAVIRLPEFVTEKNSPYLIVLCLRRASGDQSCGLGVRWFDYQKVANESLVPAGDHWVARILPDVSDLKGVVTTRMGTPSDLFWHFGAVCQ